MKIKLSVFLLFSLFIWSGSVAQIPAKQKPGIRFALQAGTGFQTLTGKDYWGEDLNNKSAISYGGGMNVILPLLPDLFVQPGLQIMAKGAKQDIISDDIVKKVRLNYLELPVNILYRPQAGNGHLLVGAGVYAAIGISGTEKTRSENSTTSLKVKFISDASQEPTEFVYYKALDSGVNLLLGYEFYSNIFCQLNGQMGILKINSDYGLPNDRTSKKNLGFGLSAGYRF
jgi:hypothetical protein